MLEKPLIAVSYPSLYFEIRSCGGGLVRFLGIPMDKAFLVRQQVHAGTLARSGWRCALTYYISTN